MLEHMCLLKQRLFRAVTILLVAVFFTNTVYGSGMMAASAFERLQQTDTMDIHHTHTASTVDHDHAAHMHAEHHKSISHSSCKDCGHCLACFFVMMPDTIKMPAFVNKPVLAIASPSLYLSPFNFQLTKPPIC